MNTQAPTMASFSAECAKLCSFFWLGQTYFQAALSPINASDNLWLFTHTAESEAASAGHETWYGAC